MDKKVQFETIVQNQIGYEFENKLLLHQAFTRKSYSAENGGENNEVMELIGDSILSAVVMRYLAMEYGTNLHFQDRIPKSFRVPQEPEAFCCKKTEGELSQIKQKLVEKKTLAKRIDDLGFADFLIMGKGDEVQNMSQQASVKEDLFEAIIGAVALDSDFNYDVLQNVVEVMLRPDSIISNGEEADYVRLIYEWDESYGLIPYFRYKEEQYSFYMPHDRKVKVIAPQGNYNLNNAKYSCEMSIRNDLSRFKAYGTSKNEARKLACKAAYEFLVERGLLFTIEDEIEEPTVEMAINQLEILARRGYFSLPEYEYVETHDSDGNPIWTVECHINEFEDSFKAVSSSKKQAKKEAAFDMLQFALENYEEE